jgi:MoaA/NifB/PqqE/SkfB family radical SAM enzyme
MIALPRIDINELTKDRLVEILKRQNPVSIIRQEIASGANTCPFIEKGSVSIRWDGAVSPCLPLLHTHVSYLDDRLRKSNAYAVGNINECSLADLWNSSSYVALRERLQIFDFSPCTLCNSCEMADGNIEDCFGNNLPACGGCLWAQGFIQCP